MISSNVTIDGVDIFDVYEAYIYKDGYRELIQWPALKAVSGNDWQEHSGFEPDLSNPRLDSRDLTITFVCNGGAGKIKEFYDFLTSKPKMTYSFGRIGRSYDLRVVSMPSLQYAQRFNIISVCLADDDAEVSSAPATPSSSLQEDRSYVIDGVALSAYGVRALKGTIAGTARRPDVKPLLLRNNSVMDGAEYDENPIVNDADGTMPDSEYNTVGDSMEGVSGSWKQKKATGSVTTRARDITLSCLLTAPTLTEAWRNYDALLNNLTYKNSGGDETLAGAHTIIIRAVGGIFGFYYRNQTVEEFYADAGKVWIKFSITLTLFAESYSGGGSGSGSGSGGGGTQLFFYSAVRTGDSS